MATRIQTKLPQPIFHEPIFNEDGSLRDPTGFSIQHPSDNALYKRIGDLAASTSWRAAVIKAINAPRQ
ncbi:MAG TPA: hypothetical protein VNZ53_39525 [Steroidobacteraceae bacterium]|jgi:hypothetical protein|nr:hypothetical protein [Steroidobacteraceae bacterium]